MVAFGVYDRTRRRVPPGRLLGASFELLLGVRMKINGQPLADYEWDRLRRIIRRPRGPTGRRPRTPKGAQEDSERP